MCNCDACWSPITCWCGCTEFRHDGQWCNRCDWDCAQPVCNHCQRKIDPEKGAAVDGFCGAQCRDAYDMAGRLAKGREG